MSTCSTATSARRGRHDDDRDLRRRLFCDCDVDGDGDAGGCQMETRRLFCNCDGDAGGCQLQTRLKNLERYWDAYNSRRSLAARLRSATMTPSSAVTAVGPDDGLSDFLLWSPRPLVYSLQHLDGSGTDIGGGVVSANRRGNGSGRLREADDASSISSVEVEYPTAPAPSCWCPHCAVLNRSYLTSSSCTVAPDSLFSPPAGGGVVTEHAKKTVEARSATAGRDSRVKWFAAVAFVVAMGIVVAMVVMDLGVDDEFLVPT